MKAFVNLGLASEDYDAIFSLYILNNKSYNMDLQEIKQRMQSLQNKGKGGGYWKGKDPTPLVISCLLQPHTSHKGAP